MVSPDGAFGFCADPILIKLFDPTPHMYSGATIRFELELAQDLRIVTQNGLVSAYNLGTTPVDRVSTYKRCTRHTQRSESKMRKRSLSLCCSTVYACIRLPGQVHRRFAFLPSQQVTAVAVDSARKG